MVRSTFTYAFRQSGGIRLLFTLHTLFLPTTYGVARLRSTFTYVLRQSGGIRWLFALHTLLLPVIYDVAPFWFTFAHVLGQSEGTSVFLSLHTILLSFLLRSCPIYLHFPVCSPFMCSFYKLYIMLLCLDSFSSLSSVIQDRLCCLYSEYTLFICFIQCCFLNPCTRKIDNISLKELNANYLLVLRWKIMKQTYKYLNISWHE